MHPEEEHNKVGLAFKNLQGRAKSGLEIQIPRIPRGPTRSATTAEQTRDPCRLIANLSVTPKQLSLVEQRPAAQEVVQLRLSRPP